MRNSPGTATANDQGHIRIVGYCTHSQKVDIWTLLTVTVDFQGKFLPQAS